MNDHTIKLNFINSSNDQNKSSVVIFQKNIATTFSEIAVAWKVIKNCGRGWYHPFSFPMNFQISASDSWGNYLINALEATNGQLYQVAKDNSGDTLSHVSAAPSRKEVQLLNGLPLGAINANIYKSGRLLATKTGISPGQKAVFEFKPTIWIGVSSEIEEGEIINSAILSNINTELGLLGIASADIVMTGGGTGSNATPFSFELDNIRYA